MATSAIGPGFLTQTATFTERHREDFAFAILASVLIDIGVQWNVWRVIGVSGRSGPEIADRIAPFAGVFLRALVILGGFAFNVGNIAGCALGLSVFGVDPRTGATVSALGAIALLARPSATKPLDWLVRVLGVLMIALTALLMLMNPPDYAGALRGALWPREIGTGSILTLVGGTVGGYITFSGAHRLLASGVRGVDAAPAIDRAAAQGILVTGLMRAVLFLAILGVLTRPGATLGSTNPAAEAFRLGAGWMGELFFGGVLWSAAMTSVAGCAYTSLTFMPAAGAPAQRARGLLLFVVASLATFLAFGRPAELLVWAGGLNGLVLPLSLGVVLIASRRAAIVSPGARYEHPLWMSLAGVLAWIASVFIAFAGLSDLAKRL
jgi:Mn2+/Fe2+ NRAMP family transporter